jgi:hypothetical protein
MNTYIIIISYLVNLTKSTCTYLVILREIFCSSFNGNQIKLQRLYKFLYGCNSIRSCRAKLTVNATDYTTRPKSVRT